MTFAVVLKFPLEIIDKTEWKKWSVLHTTAKVSIWKYFPFSGSHENSFSKPLVGEHNIGCSTGSKREKGLEVCTEIPSAGFVRTYTFLLSWVASDPKDTLIQVFTGGDVNKYDVVVWFRGHYEIVSTECMMATSDFSPVKTLTMPHVDLMVGVRLANCGLNKAFTLFKVIRFSADCAIAQSWMNGSHKTWILFFTNNTKKPADIKYQSVEALARTI